MQRRRTRGPLFALPTRPAAENAAHSMKTRAARPPFTRMRRHLRQNPSSCSETAGNAFWREGGAAGACAAWRRKFVTLNFVCYNKTSQVLRPVLRY